MRGRCPGKQEEGNKPAAADPGGRHGNKLFARPGDWGYYSFAALVIILSGGRIPDVFHAYLNFAAAAPAETAEIVEKAEIVE